MEKKDKNKYIKEKTERRQVENIKNIENEQNEDSSEAILEGYAAIYNSETIIGGMFKEIIEKGAFEGTNFDDVALYYNHDLNRIPLARSRRNNPNNTLFLQPDEIGLKIRANLDIVNNSESKALNSSIKRGDITGMSYMFEVAEEEWKDVDREIPTRIIKKVSKVVEVSAVNYPAYEDTTIYARALVSLDNEKKALDNARARKQLEIRKRRISIKTKINIGGI